MKKKWYLFLSATIFIIAVVVFAWFHRPVPSKPVNQRAFDKKLAIEKAKAAQDSGHLARDTWYKNSLIYTVDIKMFKDADGDGTGDIKGLISKLDYIKSLGTDIIWLPPFQPSPQSDDGYDISDFYKVEPRLGTMNDFRSLIQEARKRGMRVMIDLVLNHTSIMHPWFKEARQGGSDKHNWYVWAKQKPGGKDKDIVFKGYQKDLWTYDSIAKAWYYHRFYNFEPDLNTQNPAVTNEMWSVMKFWLNTGITGFRIDAVTYLTEIATTDGKKFKHDFSLLKQMRDLTDSVKPDNILLGEANVPAGESEDFFGKHGESLNMIFNFYADQRIFYAMATGKTDALKKVLEESKKIPLQSAWVYFLRNQDEMGMGRFSDKEKNEVYQAFAPSKNMQLYDRGVRRRLAPMLGNNLQYLKMAYSFLFSLQGVPMIRYGDEIGMGDDLRLQERLAVRTPMQWSDSSGAGFSVNAKTIRPIISSGQFDYHMVNVHRSESDSASLLNFIKKLAAVRKLYPAVAYGDLTIVDAGSPHVLILQYTWNESTIMTIHNFSQKDELIQIPVKSPGGALHDIINEKNLITPEHGQFKISLEAHGYRWYVIK